MSSSHRKHGSAARSRTRQTALAHISHQLSAPAGDAPHPEVFSHFEVLDVLSSKTPSPSDRKPHWARHLADLATKAGEICGLTIILAIGTFGCSSTGSLEPLQVTLVDLQISEMTLFETAMVAKLRITNPNPEALTIGGASFKLILDDKKIGTGTTKETFTVERLDSVVVDAVFYINNASALLRLKGIMGKTEVSYGIRGNLYTQGSFGTKKINIDKMGTIDLADLKGVD